MNSLKVLHLHIFNICNKIYLLFYIFNEMIFILYLYIKQQKRAHQKYTLPHSFISSLRNKENFKEKIITKFVFLLVLDCL